MNRKLNETITYLKQNNVYLSVKGENIIFEVPENLYTEKLVNVIRSNKEQLKNYLSKKSLNNLLTLNKQGNKTPLIFMHGEKADYLLKESFGLDQPYYGFIHPGSTGEKIRIKTFPDLVNAYVQQILQEVPGDTYILGGYSFGGIIAFEAAIELNKLGKKVDKLILFDSTHPAVNENYRHYNGIYILLKSDFISKLWDFSRLLAWKAYFNSFLIFNKPTPLKWRTRYIHQSYGEIMSRSKNLINTFSGEVLLFRTETHPSKKKCLGWEKYVDEVMVVNVSGDHRNFFTKKFSYDKIFEQLKYFIDS